MQCAQPETDGEDEDAGNDVSVFFFVLLVFTINISVQSCFNIDAACNVVGLNRPVQYNHLNQGSCAAAPGSSGAPSTPCSEYFE